MVDLAVADLVRRQGAGEEAQEGILQGGELLRG
jgi:hypothetical protein